MMSENVLGVIVGNRGFFPASHQAEARREIELYQEDVAADKGSLTSVELCDVCYELMQDDDLIETVLTDRKRYRT